MPRQLRGNGRDVGSGRTVVPEIGVKGGRVVAKPKAGLGRWRYLVLALLVWSGSLASCSLRGLFEKQGKSEQKQVTFEGPPQEEGVGSEQVANLQERRKPRGRRSAKAKVRPAERPEAQKSSLEGGAPAAEPASPTREGGAAPGGQLAQSFLDVAPV